MRVLGFMSGTSLDGVDAAIIETDGERLAALGPAGFHPFTSEQRDHIKSVTERIVAAGGADPRELVEAERIVVETHVAAARALIDAPGGGAVDLIGYHGQTVLHRPGQRRSIQIGSPQAVADMLGTDVIADLRQADLAAGGQGAPIVPAYHAALADWLGLARPLAFLNLGGVANLTFLGSDGAMLACDCGPGNGLIDLMVQARGIGRYDEGGRLAARGKVNGRVLDQLLASNFFVQSGPKSLDRYDFPLDAVDGLDAADAAATLVEFTARGVMLAAARLPEAPTRWVVCGGGRHNPQLMRVLRDRVGSCESADALGLRGDFIEAEAIAFLAVRSARGLPITYPGTTGVARALEGGVRYPARNRAAA